MEDKTDLMSMFCELATKHAEKDKKISLDLVAAGLEVEVSYNMYCITFSWTNDLGFGELVIFKTDDGMWHYSSELMDKDFCKLVIAKWVETVFETGICDEWCED